MSQSTLQIIVKSVVTLVLTGSWLLAIIWLWRKDVDVEKTFSPKRLIEKTANAPTAFLSTRDKDSIYQDGVVCGVVTTFTTDEAAKRIVFEEISKSGNLDLDRPFEFRSHKLKHVGTEAAIGILSSAPEKGRILRRCSAVIVGER